MNKILLISFLTLSLNSSYAFSSTNDDSCHQIKQENQAPHQESNSGSIIDALALSLSKGTIK